MHEKVLLNKALLMLEKNTDVEVELLKMCSPMSRYHDAAVKLKKDSMAEEFSVYAKHRPSVSQLGLLINNHKESAGGDNHAKMLLVADYVSPNLAHFLKENDCNFIDSVGNAYLKFGTILIYMTGNKPLKSSSKMLPSRAFQSTGLKLIFTLLCHPEDIINRSYRDLSEISCVSLGSVGWIINDLKAAGYLSAGKKDKRKWLDKEGLIKSWVVAYSEKLRPKLVLGYYQSLHENWRDKVDIVSYDACWGGEVAADALTHYLKPEFSTIYADDSLGKLIIMNGLKEAQDKNSANVEILQKFWSFKSLEDKGLAPVLLVYADLIASGDSRNLETAKLIYGKYLDDTH